MDGETDPRNSDRVLICDVGALHRPDLTTVESLCRAALAARRLGYRIRLRNVPPNLRELLEMCGVDDVMGTNG